jgi:hypothetical protein
MRWLITVAILIASYGSAAAAVSEATLDEWLTRFQQASAEAPEGQLSPFVVESVYRLDSLIRTPDDIRTFRGWSDDDRAVQLLIPLAAGRFSETRVPATFILGNVVDNTNICRVLFYLKDNPDLEPNGRYNLLQVILQVAAYAFDDTSFWMEEVGTSLRENLSHQANNEKSLALIDRILLQLDRRGLGTGDRLELLSPRRFAQCVALLGQPQRKGDTVSDFPSAAADLGVEKVRELMFSPDRREFSAHIAAVYATSPEKSAIAHALTTAIVPADSDPERRYRINLYIAVTLSKLPPNALSTEDFVAVERLAGAAEMRDPTFADNVSRALEIQGQP